MTNLTMLLKETYSEQWYFLSNLEIVKDVTKDILRLNLIQTR